MTENLPISSGQIFKITDSLPTKCPPISNKMIIHTCMRKEKTALLCGFHGRDNGT